MRKVFYFVSLLSFTVLLSFISGFIYSENAHQQSLRFMRSADSNLRGRIGEPLQIDYADILPRDSQWLPLKRLKHGWRRKNQRASWVKPPFEPGNEIREIIQTSTRRTLKMDLDVIGPRQRRMKKGVSWRNDGRIRGQKGTTGPHRDYGLEEEELIAVRPSSPPPPPPTPSPTTPINPIPPESNPRHAQTFTIVTGLFDIGRGKWWLYRRPYNAYLDYMKNLLNLKVNLIVFIEDKGADFVRKYRDKRGLGDRTVVKRISVAQLELFRYESKAKEIIKMENSGQKFQPGWDKTMLTHPEGMSHLYNLVVNSKPFLLALGAMENPFQTEFFYWFDAGYGHSKDIFPSDNNWNPGPLMSPPVDEKISLIQLYPVQKDEFNLEKLYRQDVSVVSGGFLGGHKDAVFRYRSVYTEVFLEMLNGGYLDDDQTVLVLLLNRYPQLFNPIIGDWFDGINKFSNVKTN